jgi:mono/diheme cytochrome c family protein
MMTRHRRLNLLHVSGVVLLAMLASGCAARQPSPLESAVINKVKKITVGGRKEANPMADTADNVESGRRVFARRCVFCHGADGQNTGVLFADRMSPPVPVLTSSRIQEYSDGQLKWIIDNGVYPSGMPSFKGILSPDEAWKIVRYIRHLPIKKDPGDLSAASAQKETPSSGQGG